MPYNKYAATAGGASRRPPGDGSQKRRLMAGAPHTPATAATLTTSFALAAEPAVDTRSVHVRG